MTRKSTSLFIIALFLTLGIRAQHIPLRIMSQTPVAGIEEARSPIMVSCGWEQIRDSVPSTAIISVLIAVTPIHQAFCRITMSAR